MTTELSVAIKDALQESGASFREGSKSYVTVCPTCAKTKLYIYKKTGRSICFYCASSSEHRTQRIEYVLAQMLGQPVPVIKNRLFGIDDSRLSEVWLKVSLADFIGEEEDEFAEEFVEKTEYLPPTRLASDMVKFDHPAAAHGRKYMESRGVPLEVCLRYDLRYWIPQRRVVFLVKQGESILGYQARLAGNSDPFVDEETGQLVEPLKMMTQTDFKKERALMFCDRVQKDYAVICEGPIDAIKADLCGGNVATLGKSVSAYQLNLLREAGIKKVYLALDPDAGRDIERIYRHFADLEVYDMRPPAPYKDIGEMTFEQVYELFRKAPKLGPGRMFTQLRGFLR